MALIRVIEAGKVEAATELAAKLRVARRDLSKQAAPVALAAKKQKIDTELRSLRDTLAGGIVTAVPNKQF